MQESFSSDSFFINVAFRHNFKDIICVAVMFGNKRCKYGDGHFELIPLHLALS